MVKKLRGYQETYIGWAWATRPVLTRVVVVGGLDAGGMDGPLIRPEPLSHPCVRSHDIQTTGPESGREWLSKKIWVVAQRRGILNLFIKKLFVSRLVPI